MDDDQQFCLRWNNHQSTLISVFDTLLENGTLVDCTLAAEGKFLKAHKVVLSACSPYFATLLSQQYDKHPIFILKDVKFQELRAMMDYMYRGEVNISQDQLAALLKAAESLQIKGLSDSRGNSTQSKDAAKPPPALAKASELKIENKRPMRSLGPEVDTDIGSREGSTSPTSRKRKKIRRRSIDTNNVDNHDQLSNSSSHSMPHNASLANQTQPHTNQISTTSSSATTNLQTPVTKKTEQQQKPESHNQHNKAESNNDMDETNDNDDDSETDADTPAAPALKQPRKDGAKDGANNAELLLEPKNEYDDDDGQPVEDLTLDDEELLEEDMDEAGPSHGGEGSSQGGYAQWQMERSQDEAFMAAQEAGGQHRDAQGVNHVFGDDEDYDEDYDEDFDDDYGEEDDDMEDGTENYHQMLAQMGVASMPTKKMKQEKTRADKTTGIPFAEEDYIQVTLENLDTVPKKMIGPYQCGVCFTKIKYFNDIRRHVRFECIYCEKKFICQMCDKKYFRASHLSRHMQTAHKAGGDEFVAQ